MNKTYRVKNKKKCDHAYTLVQNIGEYLDVLTGHGDRTMLIWKEDGEEKQLTYVQFVDMVRSFATGLLEQFGPHADKKIVVIGETSPYWLAAYEAAIASGNVAVPMDKELDPAEIAKFLATADASAVVYSPSFNKVFDDIARNRTPEQAPLLRIPMDQTAEKAPGICPYNDILRTGKNSVLLFTPDQDTERCCELLFTSGTTGSSKCVMLCQRNIFAAANAACQSVDITADDVIVSVLPLHHTYELTCSFIAGPNFGVKIAINDSLRHAVSNFQKYQPTALILVPLFITTMYKKIMAEAKRSGKEKILPAAAKAANLLRFAGLDMSDRLFKDIRAAFGGRLEKIICGGAALSPDMIQMFEAFGISIYEGYGITECSPLVAVTPYYKRKPGSVGPAVPCCETRIEGSLNSETGRLVGEIQVRGDNVMLSYRKNPEANEDAFTDDGWYRTGDVGYMDEDGYIFITGRMKSVIVLDNGKNVFPEEIEEYLEDIDLIAETVVIGREENGSPLLTAVIFPNYEKYPDMTENDFRVEIQKQITALNKRLPSFKQIHKIEFRKTEFEKTTTRKIKRHLVK